MLINNNNKYNNSLANKVFFTPYNIDFFTLKFTHSTQINSKKFKQTCNHRKCHAVDDFLKIPPLRGKKS